MCCCHSLEVNKLLTFTVGGLQYFGGHFEKLAKNGVETKIGGGDKFFLES